MRALFVLAPALFLSIQAHDIHLRGHNHHARQAQGTTAPARPNPGTTAKTLAAAATPTPAAPAKPPPAAAENPRPSAASSKPAANPPAAAAPSRAPAPNAPAAASLPSAAATTAPPAVVQPPVVTSPPPAPAPTTPSAVLTAPLGATDIPPADLISAGMPSQATLSLTKTYTPGTSPSLSGAPVIPSFAFNPDDWPPQDKVPPIDSPQVQRWMTELEGASIPSFSPTQDGTCAGDPQAASETNRCWWTCGGCVRSTDISTCDKKLTWGVSFDDGPGPYTPKVLRFLQQKSLKATFFVVGSRVIERSQVVLDEYLNGHELSVHTWSHHPLTSLTTPEVVAELGWTRESIKAVTGVTPTTMRPPYGDIDDRVRAIAMAMGMIPILWTRVGDQQFDTNDWKVAGNVSTAQDSVQTFRGILAQADTLNTGFIVLQHDLYPQTVDLALGSYLPAALNNNPPLTLQSIGKCKNIPSSNLYLETNINQTFPRHRASAIGGQSLSKPIPTYGLAVISILLGATLL